MSNNTASTKSAATNAANSAADAAAAASTAADAAATAADGAAQAERVTVETADAVVTFSKPRTRLKMFGSFTVGALLGAGGMWAAKRFFGDVISV